MSTTKTQQKRHPKAVFLIGKPGSGKGTQARALAQELGFTRWTVSDLLREAFTRGEGGDEERRQFDEGEWVNPSFVVQVVEKKLREVAERHDNVIIDGSLRTLEETRGIMPLAQELYGDDNLVVLRLHITDDEARRRLSQRLICSVCRQPLLPGQFHEGDSCPDPNCNGTVIKRELDDSEIVEHRLQEHHKRTDPVGRYLEDSGLLITVSAGNEPPEGVTKRVLAALDSFLEDKQ